MAFGMSFWRGLLAFWCFFEGLEILEWVGFEGFDRGDAPKLLLFVNFCRGVYRYSTLAFSFLCFLKCHFFFFAGPFPLSYCLWLGFDFVLVPVCVELLAC